MARKIEKTALEWARQLTPEQFRVAREKGTERPFSGEFDGHKASGTYVCVCCGEDLFESDHKYDSGSGWPSFYQSASDDSVQEESDHSLGMHRTEAMCHTCGAHLGHVFADGPQPTGQRFCINSASLKFVKREDE